MAGQARGARFRPRPGSQREPDPRRLHRSLGVVEATKWVGTVPDSRPSSADDKRDRRASVSRRPYVLTSHHHVLQPDRLDQPRHQPAPASARRCSLARRRSPALVPGRPSPVVRPRQPRRRRCPQPAGVAARCAHAASSSPGAAAQARPAHRPSDPAGSQRPPPGGPTPGTSRPSELIRVRRKHLRTDAPGVTWIG